MFGFFGSDNSGWFSESNGDYWFSSAPCNRNNRSGCEDDYEAKHLRNEQITSDYFRGIYGADPNDLGFQVPDWNWS